MLRNQAKVQGIALIAVLWIVAALSIAVTGITRTVRNETRSIAAERDEVMAQAVGEAAITLLLQKLEAEGPQKSWELIHITYGGMTIPVEMSSLNGWIDLNRAPESLLQSLYAIAGGLPPQAAASLARATVESRSHVDTSGRPQEFEAAEDLMRLSAVDYDLYARLAPLVMVQGRGGGRVNPMAAPLGVLTVLADGNQARAQAIFQQRSQGAQNIDTTTLRGEFLESAPGSSYRIKAYIPLSDGTRAVVSRDVELRSEPLVGLPWSFFGADYRVQVEPVIGP